MGNCEPRTTGIFYLLAVYVKLTSTAVTVTAYDGTGTVKQQPLTLGCNYTRGGSDVITSFDWIHGSVLILLGSVAHKSSRFQSGTDWSESGVFQGDFSSSLTIKLPASSVVPSVAGQYICRVSSENGAVIDTATASVQYSPRINSTFPSSRTVIESSHLQIDCSKYTTPGNPTTISYTWTYGGSAISSEAVLNINNTGRDRTGQYTCTASNNVGSSHANLTVNVQYAPQIKTTFPSSRTFTEFSRLQVDCSTYTTPGNPQRTNYTWTYGGSAISSKGFLDRNIVRDKKGQYTCTASNTVGSSNASVTVHVQYLDRPELLINKTEVKENETVSLTCDAESNPTAELEIRNVNNNTVLVERDTNRLQFTIDRVQCLHNGSFLCTARNTQTGDLSTSVRKELIVLCSPRQDYRQALIQDVKCELGDVVYLAMYVIANPSPSFDWYVKKNQQLFPIPTSTEHSIVSSKQASVLQIQVENSRDYGMYGVTVENSIGRLQMTFKVSPVALPKPPNEVTVEDVTYNSLTISWRSNDNGGTSQTFNIEFRMMKGEWRLWSEGIVDPGVGKTQKSEIRSLQPGTQYEVLVFARNPYGQSATVVREVTTYDTAPAIQGLGVGIGISVMIPVIIVILSLWCLWCRRDSKNRKREKIDSK